MFVYVCVLWLALEVIDFSMCIFFRLLVCKDDNNHRLPLYSIFTDPSNSNYFAISGRDQFARWALIIICVNIHILPLLLALHVYTAWRVLLHKEFNLVVGSICNIKNSYSFYPRHFVSHTIGYLITEVVAVNSGFDITVGFSPGI